MSRSQQESVYAAQAAVRDYSQYFRDLPTLAAWLQGVLDSETFIAKFGIMPTIGLGPLPKSSKWAGVAYHKAHSMYLKVLSTEVALHELAHLLCGEEEGHGDCFVNTHLFLVRHFIGVQAWAEYQWALKNNGEHTLDFGS